jgi:hypothetical protein
MRWLLIALLVSLGGLLLAAAGVMRHIQHQRRKLQRTSTQSDPTAIKLPERSDLESES